MLRQRVFYSVVRNRIPKFHPVEILSPLYRRYLLVPHTLLGLVGGIASLFDNATKETSTVFNTVFEWVDPRFWGLLFLGCGLMGLYGVITGSWRAFACTNALSIGVSTAFLTGLVAAKAIAGVYVSYIVIGMWLFILADSIVLAATSSKVIKTKAHGLV